MATDWMVDVAEIRSALGFMSEGWTDEELTAQGVTLPVILKALSICPELEGSPESDQPLVKIAIAKLVASSLINNTPQIRTSRIGDSSFSLADDGDWSIADQLQADGYGLLYRLCGIKPRVGSVAVFRTATGRRGQ